MIDIVVEEGCPAELIRKYVEGMEKKGQIPDMITLSPESLKRLVNGYVDEYALESDSRVRFIWHEMEEFPPMEVVLSRNENGIWEVLSIKEEASKTKPEFDWTKNSRSNGNKLLIAKNTPEDRDGRRMSDADSIDDIMDLKDFLDGLEQ